MNATAAAVVQNFTKMDHAAMGHVMSGMDHAAMGHDMSGMDHSGHDMGGMLHDGMVMTFHGGYNEVILFDFWVTKSIGTFLLSCFVLFVCGALYEGLKLGREKLMAYDLKKRGNLPSHLQPSQNSRNCHCPKNGNKMNGDETEILNVSSHPNCCANNDTTNINREYLLNHNEMTNVVVQSTSARLFSSGHIGQTFLHMLQITVSYLLMLVFMTYNTWLCLSVVLGAGVGYFFFGIQRVTSIDVNEHCH